MKSPIGNYRRVVTSQGVTLRSPSSHTGCRTGVRYRVVPPAHLPGRVHSERQESGNLNDSKSRTEPKTSGRDAGELRVVAIHCNPAPDAQDRLRRLFTLLLEHAAKDRQTATGGDSAATPMSADDRTEADA